MSLDLASAQTLATVKANVNAADFVNNYVKAFNGRTVVAPQGVGQIGAFVFDYAGDEEVDLEMDVPDHFLEDNTVAADHIAVKPYSVTLRGFVAELAQSRGLTATINALLSQATNTLAAVPAYLGGLTPGAVQTLLKAQTQAQLVALQIEEAVARVAQVASFFRAGPALNRQQAAYFQLTSLAQARIVFTVSTPFQVFDNMVITRIRALNPKETRFWSDFTVQMKQLNFTDDVSLSFFAGNFSGRAANDAQVLTSDGATLGTAPPAGQTPTSGFQP